MKNLLEETEKMLQDLGKTWQDVRYICGNGYEISQGDFRRIATGFNYSADYGHQYVPEDLTIVGDGWWLERGEYDGSEWWEFKSCPRRPTTIRPLLTIDGNEFGPSKYKYESEGEG